LDARLTALPCKKNIVSKSKDVKTGYNLTESSKEGYGSKKGCFANDDDDDDDDDDCPLRFCPVRLDKLQCSYSNLSTTVSLRSASSTNHLPLDDAANLSFRNGVK
jgi:hypothetical protein